MIREQEDKELLLKDLCARLPYGVKVHFSGWDSEYLQQKEMIDTLYSIDLDGYCNTDEYDSLLELGNIKPYLFPLSSMTEEQKEEFNSYFASVPYYGDNEKEHIVPYYFVELFMEFFHKNHIDNNGLIPMGLAIDATGKNIY